MYMQFLENKRLLILLLVTVLLMTTATLAQKSSKTGYLLGSIGIIDKSEGFIPSPNLKIGLVFGSEEISIVSDDNGDFKFIKLPIGKYCVSLIEDKTGAAFQVKETQSKCFEIKKKRTTRFDLIVVKK